MGVQMYPPLLKCAVVIFYSDCAKQSRTGSGCAETYFLTFLCVLNVQCLLCLQFSSHKSDEKYNK